MIRTTPSYIGASKPFDICNIFGLIQMRSMMLNIGCVVEIRPLLLPRNVSTWNLHEPKHTNNLLELKLKCYLFLDQLLIFRSPKGCYAHGAVGLNQPTHPVFPGPLIPVLA